MYGDGEKFPIETIIAESSPEQRAVLGFPMPGHKYWTRVTLNAVLARYKVFGFDPSPYEKMLADI
jgi:hypothetical protein